MSNPYVEVSDAVAKRRLLKLATFLDKLPNSKFDLTILNEGVDRQHPCGTKACAIGWCPVVFPKLVRPPTSMHAVSWRADRGCYGVETAIPLFGISYDAAHELFVPQESGDRSTPKKVAKNIRKFVSEHY